MNRPLRRFAAALTVPGLAALLAAVAFGDEPKGREVKAEGIRFEVPESWESRPPTNQMRKAQVVIPPAEGDKSPAEMVLFVFPGGAGTVDANVERWQNQFSDSRGRPPEVDRKAVKGRNVDVTRVEIAGTFTDRLNNFGPAEDYRLLGAIVEVGGSGYFFKLVGPEKTVKQAEADFDRMLGTISGGE